MKIESWPGRAIITSDGGSKFLHLTGKSWLTTISFAQEVGFPELHKRVWLGKMVPLCKAPGRGAFTKRIENSWSHFDAKGEGRGSEAPMTLRIMHPWPT